MFRNISWVPVLSALALTAIGPGVASVPAGPFDSSYTWTASSKYRQVVSSPANAEEFIQPTSKEFFKTPRMEALSALKSGKQAMQYGNYRVAIDHFKKALRKHPKFDLAHYHLAQAYLKMGMNKPAWESLLNAVELNPSMWEAHLSLGKYYEKSKRVPLALRHYKEAVKIHPDSAEGHLALGILLDIQNQVSQALEEYQAVVRLQPKASGGWYNLGRAFGRMGRYREAVVPFEKALTLDPNHAETHLGLGMMYSFLQEKDKAIQHILEARSMFEAGNHPDKAALAQKHLDRLQTKK